MLLESVQQIGDRKGFATAAAMGIYQEMNMVRHHNIADQAYAEFLPQHVQRLDHHLLGSIVMKEAQSPITGDGPEMDVARFVIAAQVRRHDDNISRSTPACH